MSAAPARPATWQERSTWGECPVCKAPHGQPCSADYGISLGFTVNGSPPRDGAHLARLQSAPVHVRLVGAD